MGKAVRGDFGHSLFTGEPIGTIIQKNGQNSMALISGALALTLLLAIPLGALAGVRAGKTSDHVTLLFASLAIGIPNFVLALILISYFSVNLGWFPVGGQSGFKSLILPVIVLAAEGVGVTLRMMRSSMAEQLNQDYVRALRAKGLGQRAVVWTHAMRNAMLPVISLSALRIGTIIGYTVIVEMIFRWPGIGFQLVNGVLNHDYPVAQALSLLLVASVIVINLIADLVYAAVDPRIRLTGQAKA
jgi:ABC-type dipeptide/oligopeptide/nickel transport system permease component